MTDSGIQVPELRDAIIARDGGRCVYCIRALDEETVASIDHLQPRCQGGSDAPNNLAACCRSCNSKKGGRTFVEAGMDPVGLHSGEEIDWETAAELMYQLKFSEIQALRVAAITEARAREGFNGIMADVASAAARIFVLGLNRQDSFLDIENAHDCNNYVICSISERNTQVFQRLSETGVSVVSLGAHPLRQTTFCFLAGDFTDRSSVDAVRLEVRIGEVPASTVRQSRAMVFTEEEVRRDPEACVEEVLHALERQQIERESNSQLDFSRGFECGHHRALGNSNGEAAHISELVEPYLEAAE